MHLRMSFTNHVEVLVGKEKKSFMVHKDVICARSSFFEAACSARWTRSPQKPIELLEESVKHFDIYLNIVYNSTVDAALPEEEGLTSEDPEIVSRLVATYILADKLGDIEAANIIIDEIIRETEKTKWLPDESDITIAVETLLIDSPLCRLFIDYYVHEVNASGISESLAANELPEIFWYKVLEETVRLIGGNREKKVQKVFRGDFVKRNKCKYHQHDNGHPKCATTQAARDVEKGIA